jgi:hypothetical protein
VIAERLVARPDLPWVGLTINKTAELLATLPGGFEAAERLLGSPVAEPSLGMDRDDLRTSINHHVGKAAGWVMPRLPAGVQANFPDVISIAHACLRDSSGVPTDGLKLADRPTHQLEDLHRASQTFAFKQAVLAAAKGYYGGDQAVAA